MKFTIHKTNKDCTVPAPALAVAGLKREKELRLEADNGVIVILRPEMCAEKLLSVGEFLHVLASDMIAAVALECGECSCCGECFDDDGCECGRCENIGNCRGLDIPDCLLEQAGIGTGCGLQADTEAGAVIIRALPEDEGGGSFPAGIPETARSVFQETNVCVSHLREILCNNEPLPF